MKFLRPEWNVFFSAAYFYKKLRRSLVKMPVIQSGSQISHSHGENA